MSILRARSEELSDPQEIHLTIQEPQASSTRVLRSSAKSRQSVTPQQHFYSLKSEILASNGPSRLTREQLPPEVGILLARSLSEDGQVEAKSVQINYDPFSMSLEINMPSETHQVITNWVANELTIAGINGFWTIPELVPITFTGTPRKKIDILYN
ncbi:hypothetical protein ABOM_008863 [Aspergillus bombycis]|uniref:Uncharacterized protein n=1 Tax=Aspergillus bombycis TaxID=109264 RepID=A0A1F7ZUN3_9EURO|nr:hypothetical protein ABOM_008863 [Aspergillus bombycis]OGM43173.1 hypothetical protein ABOM_008863 [Aspergillus bombycis]